MKERLKAPELRFPGFTDDWEERKLGEVAIFLNGRAYKQDELLDSGKYKVLRVGNFYTNDSWYYSNMELGDKYYVDKGDLVYTWSATFGPHIWSGEKVIYHYHIWKVELSKFLDRNFTLQLLEADKARLLSSTNGSTMIHVTKGDMESKIVSIPNIDEQKQIGSFFKQLDDTIDLHQRKLDLLKEQKKGYLQKMFPKNGAKVPELRFAGFADDWEERKLSSMTNYKNGKSHEDKQSTSGKLELINLNSISISGGLKHSGKFIDEADDTLQKDDLVMILSDVGHGDLLGRVALIPEDDRFVLNQRVALLRPNTTADPQFLFSYINAHQYYFKAQGAGMSQLNISKGSVENFISFVPIIEEQKKIGSFFKQLDETIALHQRKLDLLKEQKKGFLQKMFV
ncbi:restriction endonuclease subunit S [Lactococcus lactis]|uniref:restriction endonuclease subunit S n=1 Tax=Lactococcus lactis TaxID=1358 RepID=UPI0025A07627|nr:restriction endonuclease subunit S [Lactococcus lactis]MDM7660186.1 restriction endonuclease subunit S [Lactococcus lactis]